MAIFIRNRRPNRVNLRVANLKIGLDRRGARGDSAAIPEEAFSERMVRDYLQRGLIEQINEETFMELSAREEDAPQARLKKRTPSTALKINPDRDPEKLFQVVDFEKNLLSPKLEYEGEPNP